jgi:hypothetical protein
LNAWAHQLDDSGDYSVNAASPQLEQLNPLRQWAYDA